MNDVGIVPVVDREIAKLSAVYNKFGAGLDYCYRYGDEARFRESTRGTFAAITIMPRIDAVKESLSEKYRKRVLSGVATGFAKIFRFKTDVQFALSDHADFSQALQYIEDTGAKEVYTYGGSSELFARYLRNAGIWAGPFRHGPFGVEPVVANPIPKQKGIF